MPKVKKAHKFVPITNGASTYDWGFGCEYCGLMAFHANQSDNQHKQREKALEGCPLAPEEKQCQN